MHVLAQDQEPELLDASSSLIRCAAPIRPSECALDRARLDRPGRVAQRIEHQPSKLRGAGSSPAAPAMRRPRATGRRCRRAILARPEEERPSLALAACTLALQPSFATRQA